MTVKLTTNEKAVLISLYFNYFGEKGDGTWAWAVNDSNRPSGLPKKSIPGVIASLSKKGLVGCTDEGKDAYIYMTEAGKAAIAEEVK